MISTDTGLGLTITLTASEQLAVRNLLDDASGPERDQALGRLLSPVLQQLTLVGARNEAIEALTAAERRVLTGVAAGGSNAQVAHDLSVAPSTVRKHLEHIYRKLGVGSRMGATARLTEAAQPVVGPAR